MMKVLRTYSAFRFGVAVALVLGTALPLVGYACTMSGRQLAMAPPWAFAAASAAHVSGSVPDRVVGMLCTERPCCRETAPPAAARPTATDPETDARPCEACMTETVVAEDDGILASRVDLGPALLPLVAFAAVQAERFSSAAPLLHPVHETAGPPGASPSLRVLHASFLL